MPCYYVVWQPSTISIIKDRILRGMMKRIHFLKGLYEKNCQSTILQTEEQTVDILQMLSLGTYFKKKMLDWKLRSIWFVGWGFCVCAHTLEG